jgi:hypothetical protein
LQAILLKKSALKCPIILPASILLENALCARL